jgi:transcriptional regulator with XRE-family HTH domain
MDTPEVETQRLAEALRETIRRAKTSQRQIERTLGQGKGYLSQLLGGNVDLKVKHVFAILAVIGVEPEELFLEIYDRSDPVGAVRGLVARSRAQQDFEELKNRVARLESEIASGTKRST